VSASPDTYKRVAVCGLGRGKTRHMEDRGPYASASILPSIAATLLPLLPRYADIPRPTASFCASIPHRCSGAPGCNTHAVGASDETACHNRSVSGFDVGGYQDRVGRVGGEEQIRRVLCKPELFRTQNAKGIMLA
jgi:hypothetical protein